MWAIVKNNEIIKTGVRLPETVYDKTLDAHIKLNTNELREAHGYYRIIEPQNADVSKVKGLQYFDQINKIVTWTLVDKDYSDYVDDISGETIKQIDIYKAQKLQELDELEAELRNEGIGFVIRKYVLNESWTNDERKAYKDLYDQLTAWRLEVDGMTDAKTCHKKEFDDRLLRTELKKLK